MKAEQATVRRVGLAVAVAAALLTTGCAAGQYAQSATEQETLDGTSARIGTMTLGGLAIETPADGVSYPPGADVPLKVVVVNSGQQADSLTSITSPAISAWGAFATAAQAEAAQAASTASSTPSSATGSGAATGSATPAGPPPSGETSVPVDGHSRVQFGTQQIEGGTANRVLLLTGLHTTLYPGMAIDLTFTFERAGTVSVRVPVQLSKSAHTSVIPAPSGGGEG